MWPDAAGAAVACTGADVGAGADVDSGAGVDVGADVGAAAGCVAAGPQASVRRMKIRPTKYGMDFLVLTDASLSGMEAARARHISAD